MLRNSVRIISRIKKPFQFFAVENPRILFKRHGESNLKSLQYNKCDDIVIKLFSKSFQNKKLHCTVLFSGILTFLGLKNEEDELVLTIKKGILSIQLGNLAKAERILHHALKIAYKRSNEDGITYIYDLLANIALDLGENEKAEKLFKTVMQRLISSGYETSDIKILHISLKLAKIYENTKNYEKSEIGYKYCLEHMEDKVRSVDENEENYKDTMTLWITTLDNYARFLVQQNKIKEALNIFEKAHEVSVQVNGKNHEDTALLLNDLGTVSSLLGDLDLAVSYVEESVRISKGLPDMENISIIYVNLGYLYLAKQMYNEAESACRNGLRYARKEEDNDSIQNGKKCLEDIHLALKNRFK